MRILPSFHAQGVPAFDSLMPPVSGDFPPTEMREDDGADVPVTKPGENTSLLFGPRGCASGGTSSAIKFDVSDRPASFLYFSGTCVN